MLAKDFILESSLELQERTQSNKKFWNDEELFLKLNKAYKEIQKDLPCFICNEILDIKKGNTLYHLKHKALKPISLFINNIKYESVVLEYIFDEGFSENLYNISLKDLHLNKTPTYNTKAQVSYYYYKELENENDYLTLPIEYMEALRLLFLSFVFEKAPRDSKQRDLNIHYIKLYEQKKQEIKRYRKNKKSINTNYQRI